jgi:hypothetical protein
MFLKDKKSDDMVEVLDIKELIDPCVDSISGRFHWGEEMQEPTSFKKNELTFPSDEPLPRCWLDPNYRQANR